MEYFLSNYQKRFKRSKKHVRNLALDQVDQGVSCSTRAKIDINIVNVNVGSSTLEKRNIPQCLLNPPSPPFGTQSEQTRNFLFSGESWVRKP